MNFDYGTKLAIFQEMIFNKYITDPASITDADEVRLFTNWYVKIAKHIAPSNLVIRHLCLQQLILKMDWTNEIIKLMRRLSYWDGHTYHLWAEGYSYWGYTKGFLCKLFSMEILEIINAIDYNYQKSAYVYKGIMYPAAYGDCFEVSLENYVQDLDKVERDALCIPVLKQTFYGSDIPPVWRNFSALIPENEKILVTYKVFGKPIGFNTHIPIRDSKMFIDNIRGKPVPFAFYQGYQKKYPNKWAELLDTFHWKRFISLWR